MPTVHQSFEALLSNKKVQNPGKYPPNHTPCHLRYPPLQGDYKHLIKTLSLKYFKTLRTQEAPLLEAMDSDIAAIVASLMPRVRVYSSDMVHELGLYTNSDDT